MSGNNPQLTRREMLRLMGCAGMGIATEPLMSMLHPNQSIRTRAIPSTGEEVPVVGMGTWIQFDVGNSPGGRENIIGVLKAAHRFGGKVIDTSPMYGSAEEVTGDLTQKLGHPDYYFYATKVWTRGRQAGIDQMEASMRKMQRNRIDLMQIHNLMGWQTHLKTLRTWKEEGKVRYIGITHYTVSAHDRLEQIIRDEPIDFVQFNYSIRERNAEKSLLETARDQGVAVIINRPFEGGAIFDFIRNTPLPEWAEEFDIENWPQFFLKFILSHPSVTCVIPGTSNPIHEVEDVRAGYGRLPDQKGRNRMIAFIENI